MMSKKIMTSKNNYCKPEQLIEYIIIPCIFPSFLFAENPTRDPKITAYK